MPTITFQPFGKTITVPSGTELLDAAHQANIEIEASCGGKGTCGKCAVRITSGNVFTDSSGVLSRTAISEGYVLCCKAKLLDSDVTVDITGQIERKIGKFSDPSADLLLVQPELFPQKSDCIPLAVKMATNVPEPQSQDGLSDLDRLTRCIKKEWGFQEVYYPLDVIRKVTTALRADQGRVMVTIIRQVDRCRVIRIESGNATDKYYGIAVDVGTTTVAVQLVYLPSAEVMATLNDYNGQIDCGLDVISRINYSKRPDRLQELRERILKTINSMIQQVTESQGIQAEDICNAVIAGNTTMVHFLLGLNPEYIRLEPYTPAVLEVPYFEAREIGLAINPCSWVYFSPCVGSYVGGDITAGLLCTDLATGSADINLFIDIGTNGELVVGNHEFLMTCACSAGPAFEGGGISCGMHAAWGAIERVEVDQPNGIPSYWTIGNVKPIGICGSGMISLLANLFLTGWVDAAGKFNRNRPSPAIHISGRHASLTIVPANESGTKQALEISELDIDNIIRAKAAIYSACALMLNHIGIGFTDLHKIYIGGGFGRFLDFEKAKIIGLIPDLPSQKFCYLGNSSLMGAYMVLISQEYQRRQLSLARKMTYIDLSSEPNYMDQYTAALFLPHTDLGRFPSVQEILSDHTKGYLNVTKGRTE